MPQQLPIACTLEAADFAARKALMAELGRDALIDATQHGSQAQLRFAAGRDVRERVEAFVTSESRCCAFLTMRIAQVDDEVVLTIDAPTDAELVLEELVAAFSPG